MQKKKKKNKEKKRKKKKKKKNKIKQKKKKKKKNSDYRMVKQFRLGTKISPRLLESEMKFHCGQPG